MNGNLRIKQILFFLGMLTWQFLPGQNAYLDSLKLELDKEMHDTSRAFLLREISQNLRYYEIQEAKKYAIEALEISKKLNRNIDLVKSNYGLSATYFNSFELDSAEFYALEALQYAKKMESKRFVTPTYNLLGVIYENKRHLDKALDYYFKSLERAEIIGDSIDMAYTYANIGILYNQKEDTINGDKYLRLGLAISKAQKEDGLTANLLLNIAEGQHNADQLVLLEEALDMAKKADRKDLEGNIYSAVGSYHLRWTKELEKAKSFYKKSIAISEESGETKATCINYNNIGLTYLELEELDSAEYFLQKGAQLSEEYHFFGEIYDANDYLAIHAAKRNSYQSAYNYLRTALIARDSFYREDLNLKLADANARFDVEKKEAEIAKQELKIAKQTSFSNKIIAIALSVLLIFIGFFQWYYFNQKRKSRETKLALQIQQLEAEKLRDLDQSKSRFFANISHELRTPLTLILGPLKQALNKEQHSTSNKELNLALNNSQKLLSLVNEIMDLSKLESGRLQLYPSAHQVVPFIKRIFYAFESVAELRNIKLSFNTALKKELYLELDAPKVEKIINNLLSNALKFSNNGDTLCLNMYQKKEELIVEVIDQGQGIAQKDIAHLFNRYFQVDDQNNQNKGGTGIGLALAKELAMLHGGDIRVESEVNKGSTFALSLPFKTVEAAKVLAVDPAEEKIEAENPYLTPTYQPILLNGEKARLLIVEDNREMNAFLKQILGQHYLVFTAFDGEQALETLHKNQIDLILSDIMMPLLDGFSLRERILKEEKFRTLPFIMLTARVDEQDKIKGLQMGVDDYISKPFSPAELLARIHNTLANKIARSEPTTVEIKEEKELSADERFLQEAEKIVIEHLDEPDFKIIDLAKAIGYSQRQLSRILKSKTGLSPVEFILEIRLQKAYQLIQQQRYLSVSEVRYEVGIESASYFSKKFTSRFGISPSNLLKK